MSLRQSVRLAYDKDGDDTELVVTYDAIDLRAWEAEFGQSALQADMSVSMLTWLGHHAAIRQGQLNGSLTPWKAFDAVCFSVEGVRNDEGPTKRATRKKATDDSS